MLNAGLTNGDRRFFRKAIAVCSVATVCLSLGANANAQAVEQTFDFRVQEQTLGAALDAIVQETDIVVLYPYELAGRTGINPVVGQYTVSEALNILFRGTEFSGGLSENGMMYITLSDVDDQVAGEQEMTSSKFKRSLMASAAAFVFGTSGGVAFAQDGEAASDGDLVEAITVTATRREENILDVPYNINVVTGEDIERAGTLDTAELLRSVPGVAMRDVGYRNAAAINGIRIRGLNVDGGFLGDWAVVSVATVAAYVNDTPVFANLALEDLSRVEVLRGPQATLYGSGALGGTVRYLVNSPELGEYSVKASGTVSQVDGSEDIGYKASGTVNMPLGDTLAVRGSLAIYDYPGITDYRNVYVLDSRGIPVQPTGPLGTEQVYRNVEDADTVDIGYGRFGAYWEPNSSFNMELNFFHQNDDVGGRRSTTPGTDGFGVPYGDNEAGPVQLEPSDRDISLLSLEAELDLGFATLTSSSSYYDQSGLAVSDNTGFYANYGFLSGYYFMPRPMATAYRSFSEEAFVQEIRLVSNGSQKIDYVVGAYYMNQTRKRRQDSYYRGYVEYASLVYPFLAGEFDDDQDFLYRYTDDFKDYAVFGEATWNITDRLHLNGGFRYFKNTSDVWSVLDLPMFASFSNPTVTDETRSDNDILLRGNVSFDIGDDDLIYATVSEGYRRGGDSAVPTGALVFAEPEFYTTFDSDSVVNYELGMKGNAANIRYDLSAFYMDWKDPQINTTTPIWGYFAVINGTQAHTYGVEAQLNGNFTDELAWAFGYAFVTAEVTEDQFADFFGTPIQYAFDGDDLPGVPDHILNVALDYERPINGKWNFVAHVDGYYQSKTRNSLTLNTALDPEIDAFQIWDANIGVWSDNIGVSLFAKNIFNDEGITGIQTLAANGPQPTVNFNGNSAQQYIALPFTVGLTFNIRY